MSKSSISLKVQSGEAEKPIVAQSETTNSAKIVLRTRSKEEMAIEAWEAFPDGIGFRSEHPMDAGRVVELVICETILVEMEVVALGPLPGSMGGYFVRARFRSNVPEFNDLIYRELQKLSSAAG